MAGARGRRRGLCDRLAAGDPAIEISGPSGQVLRSATGRAGDAPPPRAHRRLSLRGWGVRHQPALGGRRVRDLLSRDHPGHCVRPRARERTESSSTSAPVMDTGPRMRLPNTAHIPRPWGIHEPTRDLRLEDVWALPGTGGPDDFPRLVQGIASGDPSQSSSRAVRTLFAIRWKLGELVGWDGPDAGLGSRVPTLGDRLPADLRDAPSGPDFDALPFTSLYLLDDEWAAEIANRTMHGVMHIGWAPDQTGGYRGQMAVLVKPNGLFGTSYMAAIRPFRHLIADPPLLRDLGREPRGRPGARAPAPARATSY